MKLTSILAHLAFCSLSKAQSPVWGQCGGSGWTGPKTCASGSTCVVQSEWYSQCLPGNSAPTITTSTKANTPTNPPQTNPSGLVGYGVGTTGGGSASPVTVTTCDALKNAVKGTNAAVVYINGMLSGCGYVFVGSNKSIYGVGSNSGMTNAGFQVEKQKNVIFRNLLIGPAPGGGDTMEIQGSTYVWIDHVEFKGAGLVGDKDDYDGQLDIVQGSDFITVSWCILRDHWKTMLIGSSDDNGAQDSGHLRVTIHHTLFKNIGTRAPLARFGITHSFNNHYLENDSAVALRAQASGWIENSVFENCDGTIAASRSTNACAIQTGNTFSNSGAVDIPATCSSSNKPTYAYTLDNTSWVKSIVSSGAGVGKINV